MPMKLYTAARRGAPRIAALGWQTMSVDGIGKGGPRAPGEVAETTPSEARGVERPGRAFEVGRSAPVGQSAAAAPAKPVEQSAAAAPAKPVEQSAAAAPAKPVEQSAAAAPAKPVEASGAS